jgi:hypothetical protein
MKENDLFGRTAEEVLEMFHSSDANRIFIENHPGYEPTKGESFLTLMDAKTEQLVNEHPELVKVMI